MTTTKPTAENLHIDVQVLDSWQPNENEIYEIRRINGNLYIEYQNLEYQFVEWIEATNHIADRIQDLRDRLGTPAVDKILSAVFERTAWLALAVHGNQPAKENP